MKKTKTPAPRKLYTCTFESPVGTLILTATSEALVSLGWKESRDSKRAEKKETPLLKKACRQLKEYFAGRRTEFDLPLELAGTDFQLNTWRELTGIAFGETISYAEQAKRVGRPQATRAVGTANGKNPIAIVIPCHRVIAKNGSLAGFGGGISAKRKLLALEGHSLKD